MRVPSRDRERGCTGLVRGSRWRTHGCPGGSSWVRVLTDGLRSARDPPVGLRPPGLRPRGSVPLPVNHSLTVAALNGAASVGQRYRKGTGSRGHGTRQQVADALLAGRRVVVGDPADGLRSGLLSAPDGVCPMGPWRELEFVRPHKNRPFACLGAPSPGRGRPVRIHPSRPTCREPPRELRPWRDGRKRRKARHPKPHGYASPAQRYPCSTDGHRR